MTTLHSDKNTSRSRGQELFIEDLRFKSSHMHVLLQGGAEVIVPLWWYPSLQRATATQRKHWELSAGGRGVHWPDIDEDLDAYGFVHGLKAPGAVKPKKMH